MINRPRTSGGRPFFDEWFVDVRDPGHKNAILDKLSANGVVTWGPITSLETFQRIAESLGTVLVQDDTNKDGIKKVDPHAAMAGTDLHTDRSSMATPPNVILIYCAAQADEGGDTILVDIASVYDVLRDSYESTLAALFTPCSVYFGVPPYTSMGAILNRQTNGRVFVKFRCDEFGLFSTSIIHDVAKFREIIDEYSIAFRLKDQHGYAIQNGRWLHGALASRGGKRIIYRANIRCELTTSNGNPVGFGF